MSSQQAPQQGPTLAPPGATQPADLSPEMYARLPIVFHKMMKMEMRKNFGCATLIFMGWRQTSGLGAATIGTFFFQGGVMMIIGSVLEWVLGNSFFAVVFATYGGFWLSYAATLNPSFAAFSSYAGPTAHSPAEGLATPGFLSSLAFWLLFMGLITFIFFLCSMFMSFVFMILFLSLCITFLLLTGALFALANDPVGNARVGSRCIVGAGSSLFVTSMSGWYVFTSILFSVLGLPIKLPLLEFSCGRRSKEEVEV
ncbi:hypothetical protein CDD80_2474 [Ophiocordyceps camponoti-rufipedis]|uniref:GPR1/FUN34/YaaH-class plasma membrane protein n=1 Tax=Ophiocordyceps camponoti-rufipedis TaxID=2004952 RepID=A0A2C5YB61_9HYPO|nr:hypothetical protein CDD80_2474 [Ophiocordyceps camponoti-rufipedis]